MNKLHLLVPALGIVTLAALTSCAVEPVPATTTTTTTRTQSTAPMGNQPVESVGSGQYGY
jgi:hypothetical protein